VSFQTVYKFFKMPFQAALVAAFLGGACTLMMRNHYVSEARILPADSKGLGGLGGLSAAAAGMGLNIGGGDGQEANFGEILNSRWVAEQLLGQDFSYSINNPFLRTEMQFRGSLYSILKCPNLDVGVGIIHHWLYIDQDPKTRILTVSAETESQQLSQELVNRAISLLATYIKTRNQTRGGAKAVFALARVKEATEELHTSEAKLIEFMDRNHNFRASSDPKVLLAGTMLENDLRLKQQILNTNCINREQALMEEKNDIPVLNVLDRGNYPFVKAGPPRAKIVLCTFLIVFLAAIALSQREWLKAHLLR